MNRRGFLSRLGAVAAVAPALQALDLHAAPTLLVDREAVRLHAAPPETPTSIVVRPTSDVAVTSPQPDLLTLRHQRGLMAPCPNCGATKWKAFGIRMLRCEGCDWQDRLDLFVAPCPCVQCFSRGDLRYLAPNEPPFVAERCAIDRDAAVGIYSVIKDGRPVRRTTLNGYDVRTDRMIHHVIEEQVARVDCAVYIAEWTNGAAAYNFCTEKYYQPNGNRVGIGWHIVDCYEWQVERGEKPAITYHRDADGRTTLVQGVV